MLCSSWGPSVVYRGHALFRVDKPYFVDCVLQDVNKDPGAEAKFKEISNAYEVWSSSPPKYGVISMFQTSSRPIVENFQRLPRAAQVDYGLTNKLPAEEK